jgi:glycosyltransferase involved in cell wall biosynthesis
MPDATEETEGPVLQAAAAVVTTSRWSRDRIRMRHTVSPDRITVAPPGVDAAEVSVGSGSGRNLLCVGPVTAAKGHDVLVDGLAELAAFDWTCTCVGALDLDSHFVSELMERVQAAGLAGRMRFTGPQTRDAMGTVRASSDLVVAPSRREAFGMAVIEGLAAGIPVVATAVGGQREAVGAAPDGSLPGALIPDGDPLALADALRVWLTDPELRSRWRASAKLRRTDLTGWADTARIVAAALAEAEHL